jgi:hypothetical protein
MRRDASPNLATQARSECASGSWASLRVVTRLLFSRFGFLFCRRLILVCGCGPLLFFLQRSKALDVHKRRTAQRLATTQSYEQPNPSSTRLAPPSPIRKRSAAGPSHDEPLGDSAARREGGLPPPAKHSPPKHSPAGRAATAAAAAARRSKDVPKGFPRPADSTRPLAAPAAPILDPALLGAAQVGPASLLR